ncbi:Mobile element protein [Tritonibacter mobilis]|nr:Mobile element protein [Tritonibacter mobilis]
MRADLGRQSFSHFDKLGPFRCQGSDKAQLFCRKTATCFGQKCEEASDEFCINPVCLSAHTPTLRKRLDLCWGDLTGGNAFYLQMCPELPFLTASRFKADNGIFVPGKIRYSSVTGWSVGYFGHPSVLANAAIQFCLSIKVLFKLPLRQTANMVASLLQLARLDCPFPTIRP